MKHLWMGEGCSRPRQQALVINWHVTEVCNNRFRYCCAKWTASGQELNHDLDNSRTILEDAFRKFSPRNHGNPLRQHMNRKILRMKLAEVDSLPYQDEVLQKMCFSKDTV